MASSDKTGGAEKYKSMSFDELKAECKKRELEVKESATEEKMINLLCENDQKPPDWDRIYAQLMFHYHMDYESIKNRTLPQIEALNAELPEQLQINQFRIPGIFGGALDNPTPPPEPTGKPPKLSEFAAFAGAFNGI